MRQGVLRQLHQRLIQALVLFEVGMCQLLLIELLRNLAHLLGVFLIVDDTSGVGYSSLQSRVAHCTVL